MILSNRQINRLKSLIIQGADTRLVLYAMLQFNSSQEAKEKKQGHVAGDIAKNMKFLRWLEDNGFEHYASVFRDIIT